MKMLVEIVNDIEMNKNKFKRIFSLDNKSTRKRRKRRYSMSS